MLNTKGSAGSAAKAERYQQHLAQVNTNLRAANSYPSPSELQQPMSRMGYGERYDNIYGQPQAYDHRLQGQGSPTDEEISPGSANAKTFPCATCSKGGWYCNCSPCITNIIQDLRDDPILLATSASTQVTDHMVSRIDEPLFHRSLTNVSQSAQRKAVESPSYNVLL